MLRDYQVVFASGTVRMIRAANESHADVIAAGMPEFEPGKFVKSIKEKPDARRIREIRRNRERARNARSKRQGAVVAQTLACCAEIRHKIRLEKESPSEDWQLNRLRQRHAFNREYIRNFRAASRSSSFASIYIIRSKLP